jgi:type II secretory pathway predicted ATPase ExeA
VLAAEEYERGRVVVLVLDEAHLLDAGQLEELRLLSNGDMDSHSSFGCLLAGQPTQRRRINSAPSPSTSASCCVTPSAA